MKFNENSFSERVQHSYETELEIEHEVKENTSENEVQKREINYKQH